MFALRDTTAIASAMPIISGVSRLRIASIMSAPMPGQPKIFSVIAELPMISGTESEICVTIGASAVRRPCLRMTSVSESPLARAVFR